MKQSKNKRTKAQAKNQMEKGLKMIAENQIK
jgi:hypothetical protein